MVCAKLLHEKKKSTVKLINLCLNHIHPSIVILACSVFILCLLFPSTVLRAGCGTEVKIVNFGSHASWVGVLIYHVLAVLHWTGDLTSLSLFPYLYDGNINGHTHEIIGRME